MDMGYTDGQIHPFSVVSAFWRFSYPGAAPKVQLQQQLPQRVLGSGMTEAVPLGSGHRGVANEPQWWWHIHTSPAGDACVGKA